MKFDKDMLKGCIEGDRRSQSKLYELSFSSLMSTANRYKVNREDAVSIVNQCFLKVLRGLDNHTNTYEEKSYFSWIKKIMINTIIDDFRKNKKHKEKETFIGSNEHLESISYEDTNRIEQMIEEEALQEMLNKLNEIQKNVFNLFAIDGFTHQEISKALEISINNSKYHLSRARKLLQSMLEDQLEKQKINQHG